MYSNLDFSSIFHIGNNRFVDKRNIHNSVNEDGVHVPIGFGYFARDDGDEDEELAFANLKNAVIATESTSADKKKRCALNHLNHYLKNTDPTEHYFHHHNQIKPQDLTDEFIGKFATYLGKHARIQMRINTKLVKWLTAVGYLSGFKSYFLQKFKNNKPSVFDKKNFKQYYTALRKYKMAHACETGEVSLYYFFVCLYKIYLYIYICNIFLCQYVILFI